MTEIVSVPTGGPEYTTQDAATSIDEFIAMLEDAKEDGATHFVLESGNLRGPQWLKPEVAYEWVD